MADSEIRNAKLVELYHRYVGEPESNREVYGYWLFLLGCVAGVAGVLVFQVEQALFGQNFAVREVAIGAAAVGLALALFGIVVLLPVRRRGLQASVVGIGVAFLAIAAFAWAYPQAWTVPPDYSPEIIGVYSIGLGVVAAVAVLVPIVTGEKGLLVEPELGLGDDEPPVLVGDATRDAFFTVFKTGSREWTWRAIQRDAVGQSAETVPSDTDAKMLVEDVREKIGSAGLLEITTAAFRLYRTADGEWRWSLVRADGSVVGASSDPYGDREAVESAVNFLKEDAADAGVVEIRGAAFEVYADDGDRWHWRLVDDRRRELAHSADSYADEAAADGGTETFVDRLAESRVLALADLGFELVHEGEAWRWRVVDGDDHRLVGSEATYDSRRDAEDAAGAFASDVTDATVVERGTPGYEVHETGRGWQWRLRDSADDIVARRHGAAVGEDAAREAAERARSVVGDADTVEFEGVDYEVYPGTEGWHWRLVDDERAVLADSTEIYDGEDAAREAARRVREQSLAADLIEFDQAAFQQYESDGEWRWRLIDEDGQVMADSGESYKDKSEVMEGMRTLKENAPDAEVLEIDTAAFEIYRTAGGEYAWRLVTEGGQLVAESAATSPTRSGARQAVEFVLDSVAEAAVRTFDHAAFQLYTDEEVWRFWLVDVDGTVLADGAGEYATRDDVMEAVGAVRAAGDGASVDVLGRLTVQLRDGSGWHWDVIDRDRERVAAGERTYESREDATADVTRLTDHADSAPVFEIGAGVVWVDRTDDGWRWRLVDEERTELAVCPDTFDAEDAAIDAVETVTSRAPEAGYLDIDTLAYELYRDVGDEATDEEAGWHWRLLDEDETVLGESAVAYADREAAADAIDDVRDIVGTASILEIDEVAFEFHERGGGWIWRLVDENGSPLAESVQPHESRQAAREEMLSVKEHAPQGETMVAW